MGLAMGLTPPVAGGAKPVPVVTEFLAFVEFLEAKKNDATRSRSPMRTPMTMPAISPPVSLPLLELEL